MSLRNAVLIAAMIALGLLPAAADAAEPDAVPGEVVVAFRSGADGADRAGARSAAEVRVKQGLMASGVQLVTVESGQTVDDAIAALEQRADVLYAEPNWIYHASSTYPDDPLFARLWGLENTGQAVNGGAAGTADDDIDAPEAWDHNRGSASTVVAVVDSGVAYDHPDLAPNMWVNAGEIPGNGLDDDLNGRVDDVRGWDFVEGDNDPWDTNDHGTHVAGTIAARGDNATGTTGVAWRASIMPLRALDTEGSGTNATITDAFTYAAVNGARVVNASLGGGGFSQAMSDAISTHPNTLFVVAAGNGGTDGVGDDNDAAPTYPCSYTAANLICVAATDNRDALAGFSNFGAASVDLAAPGVDVYSERPHVTDLFSDDFESGIGKWTVQSGPWGTQSALNTNWLVDSPNANYANNADVAIRTTARVDAGTSTNCAMKFSYGTFLQDGVDWLYVQSSPDATAWTDLRRIGHTNGSVRAAGLGLGAPGNRYYRFRLTSDASVTANGIYVDNVRLGCRGGTYGSSDFQYLNGTSMATPHVAGAAVVLFSAKPSATVAQVKAALLNTGDPLAALNLKTVSGRRLNLNAALQSPALRANTVATIGIKHPDPSVVGQPVTVHYSVVGDVLGNSAPTGTVTVSAGAGSCSSTVFEGQCTLVFTTPGAKSLTATYGGDAYDNPSPVSAAVAHQVNRADSAVAIEDTKTTSLVGEAVRIKFTVAAVPPGAGAPTGSVRVSDGVDDCSAALAAGFCDITLTTAGARTLTGTYSGDASFAGSVSPGGAHTVDRHATTTVIQSDAPDPSDVDRPVTVRYAVTAGAGLGTPAGAVTVSDGIDSCTATVAAGGCDITLTSVGARSLTATYAGGADFGTSTSAPEPHTVAGRATITTITPVLLDPPAAQNPTNPVIPQPTVAPAAARISGARVSSRRFRLSATPKLAQASRAPIGTTFTYVLDRAAPVRFDFTQPRGGRAVGGKCAARNERGPKCTLQRGSLTFAGHAGANTVRFQGWLSRTRKLTPGAYTLVLTAGQTSQQLQFTIVRG
ncbi:S8 family serine peptidase [Solirubrobacter soli]|uniref:S8 family serine peptidase n=1 Tax=Solirubrobacter soli TaxID=363832 RepID=UPI0004253F44|nr:S8 family serine peptidase [Solirubrobacter soli]